MTEILLQPLKDLHLQQQSTSIRLVFHTRFPVNLSEKLLRNIKKSRSLIAANSSGLNGPLDTDTAYKGIYYLLSLLRHIWVTFCHCCQNSFGHVFSSNHAKLQEVIEQKSTVKGYKTIQPFRFCNFNRIIVHTEQE